MGKIVLKFLKFFIIKYFGTATVEKIVIIGLRELVKRTDSKVDDQVFHAVFHSTQEYSKCKECGNGES